MNDVDMNDVPELDFPSEDASAVEGAVEIAVRSALDQRTLTQDTKREISFDAERLAYGIHTFRNAPNRLAVYRLVEFALFIGLRAGAGLQLDEVERLNARLRTEFSRQGGKKSGEKRRVKDWRQFAKEAAQRLHVANRALTLTDITERIQKDWETKKFEKVGHRSLHGYLSKLVDEGTLPRSLKRTASIPK